MVYLTEFHDEMKADWLASYGAPCAPLGTVRLSQRECKPRYHGLEAFGTWHAENYLRSMLAAEPESFEVRYQVGKPDMVDVPTTPEGVDVEAARKAMAMWGDDVGMRAASSRRNNPYLREAARYIEYTETIVPSRVAQLIMRTRQQIAQEFETDLRSIGVGEFDRFLSCRDEDEPCNPVVAYSDEGLETAYALTVRAAPIFSTFEDFVSSPLRTPSLDLCDRLATREAALKTLPNLAPAEAAWLRSKLELVDDSKDDSSGDAVLDELRAAACRLVDIDALSGHARRKGLAIRWLRDMEADDRAPAGVDPLYVAAAVRDKRVALARDWAAFVVDYVVRDDQVLLKASLEAQLAHSLGEDHPDNSSS